MDHLSVVSEGRAALQATLRFGARHLGPAKWEPEPGSEAAAELSNTETCQGGDPWGEDPPRTAYAAANLLMTGVLDDLASVHQILGAQGKGSVVIATPGETDQSNSAEVVSAMCEMEARLSAEIADVREYAERLHAQVMAVESRERKRHPDEADIAPGRVVGR